MLKKLFIPILLCALISTIGGCNSDSDSSYEYTQSSSVLVSGFYINNDSKVLDSLQNVFFSIDLENGRIFNADSMPYGTDVSHLIPNITAPSTASEVSLKFYSTEIQRDSVVNYLTNSTDSIDFSAGPVTLTVKSEGGLATKDYEIRVNVHKVKADSLAWYSIASATMPETFGEIKAQWTAHKGSTFYTLTTDGTAYDVSTTTDPYSPNWQTHDVEFGFTPRVETLRATTDALYILADDETLYTSADFITWTSTSQKWHYIYGEYEGDIFGSQITGEGNRIVFYPSGISQPMPADFPIEGTTLPATYTMPMGDSAQLVMLGGRKADGTPVKGSWSFDGSTWADVTNLPIEEAYSEMIMVPYHLVEVKNTNWKPESYPVLLAIGGRNAEGEINEIVYYSRDWGMSWREAPELVQLPDAFPGIYGAAAFEYSTTMYAESRAQRWVELPLKSLPHNAQWELPMQSRAIAPITQWECPAIYIFGGRGADGKAMNTLWRGVIYNFTFKPVQ